MKQCLNLGCGTNILKDYINVDKYDYRGVDIVHDLDKFPYPFKDNSVDKILMEGVIEHLKSDYGDVFNEFRRIMKHKAKLIIIVPHASNLATFNEFHIRHFSSHSFTDIQPKGLKQKRTTSLDSVNAYRGFRRIKRKIVFRKKYCFWDYLIEPIVNLHWFSTVLWEHTFLSRLFPAKDIYVELEKVLK